MLVPYEGIISEKYLLHNHLPSELRCNALVSQLHHEFFLDAGSVKQFTNISWGVLEGLRAQERAAFPASIPGDYGAGGPADEETELKWSNKLGKGILYTKAFATFLEGRVKEG